MFMSVSRHREAIFHLYVIVSLLVLRLNQAQSRYASLLPPSVSKVTVCHPWLDAELAAIRPNIIICLSLLGHIRDAIQHILNYTDIPTPQG
jgi:uracil-DNA glycosylase